MKFKDLEEFCFTLIKTRKTREIGLITLEHEIAKTFGFTSYKMKNVKDALFKYKLVERIDKADRFMILYPPQSNKEIGKEVDDLLDKFE